MSGAHDWPLLYSVPRWRQEEEASAPSLLWQEDLLKKREKFKKKIPSNRHGITLSNVVEDCQLIRGFGRIALLGGRIALLGAQLATAPVYVLFEI